MNTKGGGPKENDERNPIHSIPVPEVYRALSTSSNGLAQAEAEQHLGRFGRNVISEIKGKSLILKFFANFTQLMTIGIYPVGERTPGGSGGIWEWYRSQLSGS